MTARSWIRNLFAAPVTRPSRKTPIRRSSRLAIEPLEDRLVPVNQLDVGNANGVGLRFLASTDFIPDSAGTTFSVGNEGDIVSVGFVPEAAATFEPLLQFTVGKDASDFEGSVEIHTSRFSFEVSGAATMDVVAVGGSPGAPIPIWKQTDVGDDQVFDIPTLTGLVQSTVQAVDTEHASPFTVLNMVDFQLTGLALAHNSKTNAPQVLMQGTGTLTHEDLLKRAPFVKNLQVQVKNVVAEKSGIDVTGLKGSLVLSAADATLGGMNVTGTVNVGYAKLADGSKEISLSGDINLTSPPDSPAKLKNVSGGLDLDLHIDQSGHVSFDGFGVDVGGAFSVLGLDVQTLALQPISFNYHIGDQFDTLKIGGGLQFSLKGNTVSLMFGSPANPGLAIDFKATPVVTLSNATLMGNITISGVKISTSPSNGINVSYDGAKGLFKMYGGVSVTLPGGANVTGQLGNSTNPGVIYDTVAKDLQQLNASLSGSFTVYGLTFRADNFGVEWKRGDGTAQNPETFEVSGDLTIDFKALQANVSLGTGNNPGLVIKDGAFVVDNITIELDNVKLGPLNLQELKVSYKNDPKGGYDVDVEVRVGLPGGYFVGGEFVVIQGKLDSISLSFFSQEGIALGESGVKLVEVDATVKNIENPSQIVVEGKVGVVYGETISMLGQEVNLFHAEGDLTVDANEFILDCTAQIGAYSTDNGRTWKGVLGQAEGKLSLNWQSQIYSLHIEVDGLMAVFDIEGDLVFAPGREIALLAEADVVIPTFVPFVGGQKIGGLGFFFEHVFPHGNILTSTTLAAWLDFDLFTTITVGFEVVIDGSGKANWGLIGASEVAGFRAALNPVDQTFTYSTDLSGSNGVPAGTTSILAKVDWARPATGVNISTPRLRVQWAKDDSSVPIIIEEKDFAKYGIAVVTDARLTSSTSKVIHITNLVPDPSNPNGPTDPYAPLQGDYTLLVDVDAENGNPFPNFGKPPTPGGDDLVLQVIAHSANPIFGDIGSTTPYQPAVASAPTGTFPVTVTGHADEAYLTAGKVSVSLYQVSMADPFRRPVLIDKVQATRLAPNGSGFSATFNVPIDSLAPSPYTLLAVVDDSVNPPVTSDPSAEFTPTFAVRGTVTDQNGTPITGSPVFLDYNQNGAQDPNEPGTTTGPNGYAFTGQFDPSTNLAPVPVNKPFDVVLSVNGSVTYAPFAPNQTVSFDGTKTVVVPYALKANTGIRGVLFDDTESNGDPTAGLPVSGALAYLDTNNNGVRDPDEPTAITDTGGVYYFTGQDAGTYIVRVDMSSIGRGTPGEAYAVPAGTPGSETGPNAGQYTYGMTFTTERPVAITSLGVFDDNSDGLTTTLTAVLYDATTKVELARLTFTSSNPGTLVGGTRYLDLLNPIILPAGFKGMIVAYGFGATADRAGNAGFAQPLWTTDGGAGRVSFVGGSYANTPNTYPTIPLEFRTPNPIEQIVIRPANPYAAGSFQYRDVPWAPSPSSATSHQVTLDNSGFDLAEKQDFGLLPPTIFFGQVSGQPLVNGKTQPLVPQAGVPVGLIAERVVLAINSGGGGVWGTVFTGDQYVTNGTEISTLTDIDTSRVPNAPAVGIYESARVGNDNDAGSGGFTYALGQLSPGGSYTVRLHFAEIQYQVAGQRKFDVSINGTQVLLDFDIVATAGGPNTACFRDFQATANANGQIVINFTAGSADNPLVNAIQVLSPLDAAVPTGKLAIDAGSGVGNGNFVADEFVTGGSEVTTQADINTTRVLYSAPVSVYQSVRSSAGGEFTYTLPNFEPGRAYSVRLHFAEIGGQQPGQRKFNVDINGQRMLTDFDIAATAGGINTAIAEYFDTVADANGNIVVAFRNGSINTAIVSGIEVLERTNAVSTAVTDAQGNYALVAYGAGQYTVVQQPPAGWEQEAPSYSNPVFSPTTAVVDDPSELYSNNSSVATADFNGDGRMDMVVTTVKSVSPVVSTLNVNVLYNQPDGSFKVERIKHVAYSNSVPLLTVGDFNGDHRPDLAYIHSGLLDGGQSLGTHLYLVMNNGDATDPFNQFKDLIELNPMNADRAQSYYSAIASGDIDKDGKDDLVLGFNRPYGVTAQWAYITNIDSAAPGTDPVTEWHDVTPAGWPYLLYTIPRMAVADVDGNGYADVIMTTGATGQLPVSTDPNPYGTGTVHVIVVPRQDKTTWATPQSYHTYSYGPVTGLAVGPLNTGALPNLYTSQSGWNQSTSAGTTTSTGPEANFVVGTNSTNFPDFGFPGVGTYILEEERSELESWPNEFNPNFNLVSGLRLRDMNGDTLPDLVYLYAPSQGNQSIAIRLNNGKGRFDFTGEPSVTLPLASNLTDWVGDFEVADFDGDGLNDIFVLGTGNEATPRPNTLFLNETPQNKPGVSLFAAAGSTPTGLDFQNVQMPAKSAVHGKVFEDANRNGVRETGDKGLAGTVVFADLNRNSSHDAGEPQATTTSTGHYVLPGLADGKYSIGVLANDDWKAIVPDTEFTEVIIANGSVVKADFGRALRLIGDVETQTIRVGETLDVTIPMTEATAGRRLVFSLEGTYPAGMTIDSATGRLTWSPTGAHVGTRTVTVRVRDPFDTHMTETQELMIEVPRATPSIAVGGGGRVRMFSTEGTPLQTLVPFGTQYRGPVRVATGDVNGDGVEDVIAAAGAGARTVVVLDGATGEKIASVQPFKQTLPGGLFVAAGDVNGDGLADIIVGAGAGSQPRVRVFSGEDQSVLADILAFSSSFRGGVRVAAGDVNGDGKADVIVGTGQGAGRVSVFDGATNDKLVSFLPYGSGYTGGLLVAAGDVDGDGRADVITGNQAGSPRVRIFDGAGIASGTPGAPIADFVAGPASSRTGARVAFKPAHANNPASLIVGYGDRGRVTAYKLPEDSDKSPDTLFDLDILNASSGVFVG